MKRKCTFLAGLFSLLVLMPCGHAEDDVLRVNVSMDQNSADLGMMFLANVQVLNTGEKELVFWANSCSYEKHWVIDNPEVLIQAWTCEENEVEPVTLQPRGVYEKNVILYVPKKDKSGDVVFRLGFKRMAENGDVMEPLWSEPLGLHVRVPEENAAVPVSEKPDEVQPAAPLEALKQQSSHPPKIYQDPVEPIRVRGGEEFLIILPANATTGYRWDMKLPEGEKTLSLLGSEYIAPEKKLAGAPGDQSYRFKALKAGETRIDFVYRRPWEPEHLPTRKVVTVIVQEK